MLKSKNLLLAALLAGLASVSFAQTPAAGTTTESTAAASASKPVAEAAGTHEKANVKKVASKKRPAKMHHKVAKKHVAKPAAKPAA